MFDDFPVEHDGLGSLVELPIVQDRGPEPGIGLGPLHPLEGTFVVAGGAVVLFVGAALVNLAELVGADRSIQFDELIELLRTRAHELAKQREDVEEVAVFGIDFRQPDEKRRAPSFPKAPFMFRWR